MLRPRRIWSPGITWYCRPHRHQGTKWKAQHNRCVETSRSQGRLKHCYAVASGAIVFVCWVKLAFSHKETVSMSIVRTVPLSPQGVCGASGLRRPPGANVKQMLSRHLCQMPLYWRFTQRVLTLRVKQLSLSDFASNDFGEEAKTTSKCSWARSLQRLSRPVLVWFYLPPFLIVFIAILKSECKTPYTDWGGYDPGGCREGGGWAQHWHNCQLVPWVRQMWALGKVWSVLCTVMRRTWGILGVRDVWSL